MHDEHDHHDDGQRADHVNGGIGALDVLCIAHDNVDAGSLQLLHLLFSLGHGAHEKHLRLKRDDLLNIRLIAGLNRRNIQNLRRIVAVFAAADQQIARAQRVENFAVSGSQRDDALCGRVQRDLATGHIGQGNRGGGVLCFRFLGGSRFFLCRGGLFRFGTVSVWAGSSCAGSAFAAQPVSTASSITAASSRARI